MKFIKSVYSLYVFPSGDTVSGLIKQHKQAMQFIAYEKKEGVADGSRPGTWGGYSTNTRDSNFYRIIVGK